MVVLVTGGAGFIGSHVCDALLEEGKKVICLDNLDPYYSPEQKLMNIKHNLSNNSFKFYQIDITHKDKLEEVFKTNKINKIIHLAARAGVRPSIENPEIYVTVNILGTVHLLEMAKKYNIKKFVYASSSSVYGALTEAPFHEEQGVNFPLSPYAASKRAGELYCWNYHKLHNLSVACLRFFTVYGPRGRPDMAPYLFTASILQNKPITLFGNGDTLRDYTYISDIVSGILAALDKPLHFEIFNLGNSNPTMLKDFVSLIEKIIGQKAIIRNSPLEQGDARITHADIRKAKKMLDFQPKVSLDKGMSSFIEWFINPPKVKQ